MREKTHRCHLDVHVLNACLLVYHFCKGLTHWLLIVFGINKAAHTHVNIFSWGNKKLTYIRLMDDLY